MQSYSLQTYQLGFIVCSKICKIVPKLASLSLSARLLPLFHPVDWRNETSADPGNNVCLARFGRGGGKGEIRGSEKGNVYGGGKGTEGL